MSEHTMATKAAPAPNRALAIGLWSAQVTLAGIFGMAGVSKSFLSPADLVAMGVNYATELPEWLLRFIGASELLGAIGIILPALTRILPRLTPLAALGFVTILVLAIGFHAARGDLATALPFNLALLGLSLFVVWGRWFKAPIAPRS
ncbi:DoxX family protein [Mesorhizobium sp.]|uniref:DoxX family protein n=1 Tax=Mesorhizobium sp. TaxID=1871066 RepID=UPI00120AC9FB|nr:DoxX family protein [Mesorhizobium sp.]TIQ29637.1 MAG: DoxX family protein [Mesorhizobium sp.]